MTETPNVTVNVLTAPPGETCPKCRSVCRALDKAGVTYTATPITEDQRAFYVERGALALPVVEVHSPKAATVAYRVGMERTLTPAGRTVAFFSDNRTDLVPKLAHEVQAEAVSTV